MTYSILGFDPERSAFGGAVQSKFPGVGNLVLHVRPDSGVIVTQAFSNPLHPERGFPLLRLGAVPGEVLEILLRADPNRGDRQIGILQDVGAIGTYTGENVARWDGAAGARIGRCCVALGNSLSSLSVLEALCRGFEEASGELGRRLVAALAAGEAAGGELRGQQAAAVKTARIGGGYAGAGLDVEISVYDHARPIEELTRCYALHRLAYFPSDPSKIVEIDAALRDELGRMLVDLGYLSQRPTTWSESEIAVMARFMGVENYDNRIRDDARIDLEVLEDLRRRHAAGLLVHRPAGGPS